jgi:valyl-tRNA synthetase
LVVRVGPHSPARADLTALGHHIRHLAKVSELTLIDQEPRPAQSAAAVVQDFELFVPLEGLIDFPKEKARLEKNRAALEADLARLRERLEDPTFTTRAPAEKVEDVRTRLKMSGEQLKRLTAHLAALER